jgi:hypothetical protein
VAAYQQVGSFEVVDEHGTLQRNGGNVASYFCTPDGRVIHAVTGPVAAAELLDEARWAVTSYANTAVGRAEDAPAILARAHREAGAIASNNQTRAVHQLLANKPMPALQTVFQNVFERILGQKLSLPGEGLDSVVEAVAAARERKLPIMFILHKDKTNGATIGQWNDFVSQHSRNQRDVFGKLADSFVVVTFPLNLLPAVSLRLGIRPFAAPDKESPLFVVSRSDGRQLTAVTTWNKTDELTRAMALGVVQEAKEQPRTPEQLAQLLPLVTPVDLKLAAEVKRLTTQSKLKALPARPIARGDKVALSEMTPQGSLELDLKQ